MVKHKPHKGARKRMKLSASGKVKYKSSFSGHLMSGKSGNRKRAMRKAAYLEGTDARKMRAMIE
jgi:large subunit ribosomal protein L35